MSSTADNQCVGRPSASRSTGKRLLIPRTRTSGLRTASDLLKARGVETTESMRILLPEQFGVFFGATRNPVGAAGRKTASSRQLPQFGHTPRNYSQNFLA